VLLDGRRVLSCLTLVVAHHIAACADVEDIEAE
jgi:hypothetical protein